MFGLEMRRRTLKKTEERQRDKNSSDKHTSKCRIKIKQLNKHAAGV